MGSFIETIGAGGLFALLAVFGALFGGACGHWFARRGRDRMVSGAIMGAIMLPLGAIVLTVHVTTFLIGALATAAVVLIGGVLG